MQLLTRVGVVGRHHQVLNSNSGITPLHTSCMSLEQHKSASSPASCIASAQKRERWTEGERKLHRNTLMVESEGLESDPFDASMPPIYQTATFGQPNATENGPYDYSRSGNPTRTVLEKTLARLERADRAFAYSSGMSALAAVTRLLQAGDHVVAGDDLYGGTSRLLSQVVPSAGIEVTNIDTTDIKKVQGAIIPGKTKLIMLESPTNPRMQVCDIKAICDLAKSVGAITCVDNSILTPLYQMPLDLGADISMTSATKFIGGHSDVTGGVLAVRDPELAQRLYFVQNAEGTGLGPMDCWLLIRGLKTMSLRMERQVENCEKLVEWVRQQPLVKTVNYAGLEDHPGHNVHSNQATSAGSLFSFTTGDEAVSKIICDNAKLFKITVSFGNVHSLISMPCFMSHASIPAEVRAARGLPNDLIRISAGIEHIDDLIYDLECAFAKAQAYLDSR
jgi:cystathionine beta-lyase